MALTRKEEQTFRDLMAEACEGDPRFATKVSGERWRRFKVHRVLFSLTCFAIACLVLGLGSTAPAWVAGGVLFCAGAGTLVRPLLIGRLPSVSWKKLAAATVRPFIRVGARLGRLAAPFGRLPRHLPRLRRRAS